MKKQLQNKIAESKLALPVIVLYALVVWLLCGLITEQWWLQFGCFAISTYLMVELNNVYALIRIYSRMVSCTFLALACCGCFLFPSLRGAIFQLCFIGSIIILFHSYQDKQSVGTTYYSFLMLGLASMAFVHIVFLIPILWILMGTHLQSLSWRTFGASLLGVLTPYWISACWFIYQEDFTPLFAHFETLVVFDFPFDYQSLSWSQILYYFLIVILTLTGIVHYIRRHQGDKIRIRLLYGFFAWIDIVTLTFLALQPQHYDALIRVATVCTAPLLAHFIALTNTKVTNIAFFVIIGTILILTTYTLWTASSLF